MEKGDRKKLQDARESLAESIVQIVTATPQLLKPLEGLSNEQKDAVAILGIMIQSIGLAKRPHTKISEAILTSFKEEIDGICPPLGAIAISEDPCFSATVEYLSALKECEDEGRDEEDCPDAWGPGGQAVMCAMDKIEEMKVEIGGLLGRQEPPKPIPWPIDR